MLLVGSYQESPRLGWIMFGGAATSVVVLVLFATTVSFASLPLALGLAFLIAATASGYLIVSMTVMQLMVPDALRGRVMGIHTIGYSLVPLGGLFLGGLAESVGAGWAVTVGGAAYLVAISITALSQPKLLALDGSALQSAPEAVPEDPQPLATR